MYFKVFYFQFLIISGCEPVVLFEDTMLSGFVPLMSAPLKLAFVHSTVDKVTLSLDIEIRCWLIPFAIVVKK